MSFELFRLMLQTACADGTLTGEKRERIEQKAKELNISEADLSFLIETELQNSKAKKHQQSGFTNHSNDSISSGFVSNPSENSGFISENKSNLNHYNTENFTEIELLSNDGAMSIIQKAKYFGKWVVIKRIKPEFENNKKYRELFQKEFQNAYHLDHPNIVRIISKGSDAQGLFYFMEFIDGQPLNKIITEKGICKGNLIKKIATEILQALDYVHKKQIFHRDLKPQNILLTYKGDNVKLIDFGLAAADSFQDDLQIVGTPKYSSPEQKVTGYDVDGRSDIFSFGLIFLEMLTGQIELSEMAKNRNEPLFYLISKCTQPEISARYRNCADIIAEIQTIEISDLPEIYEETKPINTKGEGFVENEKIETKIPIKQEDTNSPFQTITEFFEKTWNVWKNGELDELLPKLTTQKKFSTLASEENAFSLMLNTYNDSIIEEINREYFFVKNEVIVKIEERYFLLTNFRLFIRKVQGFQVIPFNRTQLKETDGIISERIYVVFAGYKLWKADWEIILKTYNLKQWLSLPELQLNLLPLKIPDYRIELEKQKINLIPELYGKQEHEYCSIKQLIEYTTAVWHSSAMIKHFGNRYLSHYSEINAMQDIVKKVFKENYPLKEEYFYLDALHDGLITNKRVIYFDENIGKYNFELMENILRYSIEKSKVQNKQYVIIHLKNEEIRQLNAIKTPLKQWKIENGELIY